MAKYTKDKELTQVIDSIQNNAAFSEFKVLREYDAVVLGCFSVKMDKDDDVIPTQGFPAKLSKVSDLHQLWMEGHYILVIDQGWWMQADQKKRDALVHSMLMRAEIDTSKDSITMKVRGPSVVLEPTTVKRYGRYDDDVKSIDDALKQSGEQAGNELAEGIVGGGKRELPTEEEEEEEAPKPKTRRRRRPQPVEEDEQPRVRAGAPEYDDDDNDND